MSTTPPASTPVQLFLVRRAAVLGAGTMGSRIAAHLANAGIPTVMLDIPPKGGAAEPAGLALGALAKSKPAAFYDQSSASLITPGNFDDDLAKLAACDWVIEAVAENLEIKTALLARVLPHLAPHALLTTNTSGLPVGRIAQALPSHRDRFFGTHFFNPPRYMRLLEVVPTPDTDRAVLAAFAVFADRLLGKQVVFANDTPNFIANRVGINVMFTAANLMLEQGLTIEEVDAFTGPALGWPRTGTFRLADLVGIDILAHVASNFPQGVSEGKFSSVLAELMKRNWLGDKSGRGFYNIRVPPRSQSRPALAGNGKERGDSSRAPSPFAGRRPRQRQGGSFSLAISRFTLELCRRAHRRSRRRRTLHRSGHARRFQLGAWPLRDVGCRRRPLDRCPHEDPRPAREPRH
jgi:3-hydroxyacyl-CoA dehydrogenase